MSTSEDHEGLADELERETEALKRESDRLGEEISAGQIIGGLLVLAAIVLAQTARGP